MKKIFHKNSSSRNKAHYFSKQKAPFIGAFFMNLYQQDYLATKSSLSVSCDLKASTLSFISSTLQFNLKA